MNTTNTKIGLQRAKYLCSLNHFLMIYECNLQLADSNDSCKIVEQAVVCVAALDWVDAHSRASKLYRELIGNNSFIIIQNGKPVPHEKQPLEQLNHTLIATFGDNVYFANCIHDISYDNAIELLLYNIEQPYADDEDSKQFVTESFNNSITQSPLTLFVVNNLYGEKINLAYTQAIKLPRSDSWSLCKTIMLIAEQFGQKLTA